MGIILGPSLKHSGASNPDLVTLDQAPEGAYDGLRLNITMPMTVTGTPTPATADLLAFLTRALSAFTVEEGPRGARSLLYSAVTGADLRELHRRAMRGEVPNNFVGVVQAAGATNWTANVVIPFTCPRWLRQATARRPGHTQVRTLTLRNIEGAAAPAVVAVARAAGTMTIDVEYVVQTGADAWAPMLSMGRESSPRRDATGPDGLTLAVYTPASAAAASALTAYKVEVGGRKIVDVQLVAAETRAFTGEVLDAGAPLITDTVTVLYHTTPNEECERLPHGPVRVEEAKSDLSPLDLRFIYLPAANAQRCKAEAKHSADAYKRRVVLTQEVVETDADQGAAALQGRRIFTEQDARFNTSPGLFASPGSEAVTVAIPADHRRALASLAKDKEGSERFRRARWAVAAQVPGAMATTGNREGDVGAVIDAAVQQ